MINNAFGDERSCNTFFMKIIMTNERGIFKFYIYYLCYM